MKIALITDGIWPYVIGGMQKHSYFLCKYLAKNHVDVLLVHTATTITKEIKNLNCFTDEEKKYINPVIVEKPRVKSFPGHYIYQGWLYSKKIYETLNGFPAVDFIIAKGMTGWYFLHKKDPGAPPVAINIHGYEFMQKKSGFKMQLETLLLRFPLTWVNRHADYIFSYGGKITGYIKKLGISSDKIIEIPAAIEREWMNADNVEVRPERRFLFIGRYERRKGIEEINAVIIKLAGKYRFSFAFVGPIPENKRLDLPEMVYHGTIRNREDLQAILAQSDVLVCPSYSEGMPNVILEGMANGCAVIATDVGAVSLLVNEQNGWLIPPADSHALETAIADAINCSNEMLQQKKRSAYRWIAGKFLWPDVSQKLISAIEDKLSR
ncbi:glycosyltransferase family 4 protein [Agriterribacter humi]|uniref:glycosyltransferase family 4 protein n=1 Tax=Agriterribacter humi TaxID=1104781 RepID=UPI001263EC21|nr:glycosyltransferase family 4 protein [Agriterribacter humi]